jgi:hypothetical protein
MKVLDLKCTHQHVFEGWFASEDDFQAQRGRGLVSCPICGDAQVEKQLSAPRLNLGAQPQPPAKVPSEQAPGGVAAAMANPQLQALWLKDRGQAHAAEAAMCKWWAPKLAYDVVHQCLLMHGHGGYDRGPMEQRLRDILGFQIGDGTAQIMKTVIARARAGRKSVPA